MVISHAAPGAIAICNHCGTFPFNSARSSGHTRIIASPPPPTVCRQSPYFMTQPHVTLPNLLRAFDEFVKLSNLKINLQQLYLRL